MGWFWFAGTLVPVIGLVQVGLQAMADHYTYLPLIGIFIALAWGLAEVGARAGARHGLRSLPAGVSLLAVTLLAVVSAVQVRYWKNSETLFTHATRVTTHNTVAHYILGALAEAKAEPDAAAAQFADAIADDPGKVKARCGLGYVFCNEGKLNEAAREYQAALAVAPGLAKAHFGLGDVFMKQRNFGQATREYNLALKADPDIPEAHYQAAALLNAGGNAASAISQLEAAVRLAPDWALALNNLAWMRATSPDVKLRDGAEAARLAKRAVALTGKNDPSTLDTLAAAYAETGDFTDAATTAMTALESARSENDTNPARDIQTRLTLYQSRQPYREQALTSAGGGAAVP